MADSTHSPALSPGRRVCAGPLLEAVLEYFALDLRDLEVSFGRHLVLRGARLRDASRKDLFIPIDSQGRIIVNFAVPTKMPSRASRCTSCSPPGWGAKPDPPPGPPGRALVLLSDTSTAGKDYGPGIFDDVYPLSGLHLNIITASSRRPAGGARLAGIGPGGLLCAALLCFPAAGSGCVFRSVLGPVICGLFVGRVLALQLSGASSPTSPRRLWASASRCWQWALTACSATSARNSAARRCSWRPAGSSPRKSKTWIGPTSDYFSSCGNSAAPAEEEPTKTPDFAFRSEELKNPAAFAEIVTHNEQLLAKFRYIESIAENDNPVLITGESGVARSWSPGLSTL